ncbi:MAG: hypothetical protein ACK56I_12375, partial [bacterium]
LDVLLQVQARFLGPEVELDVHLQAVGFRLPDQSQHLARLPALVLYVSRHQGLLELEAAPLGHGLHLLGELHQPLLGFSSGRGIVHVGSVLKEPCSLLELALIHRGSLPGRGYRDASRRSVSEVDCRGDVHLHLG